MCSSLAGAMALSLWAGPVAFAGQPTPKEAVSEVAVVRAALSGPVVMAQLHADELGVVSARAVTPRTLNPSLDVRHEQANGPAGASSDAIGGSWTLGLGLPGLAEQAAARDRGEAAQAALRSNRIATICAVRRDVVGLWNAVALATISTDAHRRLQNVADSMDALAGVGDLSGHDSARATLAVLAHQSEVDHSKTQAWTAQAQVEAWTGGPVGDVELAPLGPLPSTSEAIEQALARSPELAALTKARQAVASEHAVAVRSAIPALTVSGGGRWDGMPDGDARTPGYEVGAALELPVFDRNQSERATLAARLGAIDADIARMRATIAADVLAAATRAAELVPLDSAVDSESIWQGARDRALSGEESLESLFAIARDLEAAERAQVDAQTRHRLARLTVSCAQGTFPSPEFQSLVHPSMPEVSP